MNRCICCGKSVPEGRQICFWCEANVTIKTPVPIEMSKGELTNEIVNLGKQILGLEDAFDKLSLDYLELCNTLGVRH
jgi:hypothetical protein